MLLTNQYHFARGQRSSRLLHCAAMSVHEFRKTNLERLIKDYGDGIIERFAALADQNPSYLSQIRTGNRGMGNRVARRIETTLGLPDAWMDVNHEDQSAELPVAREQVFYRRLTREQREAVTVIIEAMVGKS